jgi:hypothetical protein
MLVISTSEFGANPKTYFDKLDEGISIFIKQGKDKFYKISSVKEDDTLMTREEFSIKINRAVKQVENGHYKILTPEYKKELLGL